MPAAQVEIGEQEDDQGRREGRLDARAPDALRGVLEVEHLSPEAEVDADIGEHRPGERRGGRENQRAAHDEDDREEQRQQARDADQDALVEGQAGRLVLEGVRLPQIELGQVRGAQFRNVGDGRAGVERQAEHVGLGVVLPFGRGALARGDRRDAGRAQIRPDHAGADQPEMRRDDQAGELLVGIVGERKHNPGGLRPGLERADFDAPHDAVGARRRRNLNAVALRAEVLDGVGEVDRVRIRRHPHRLHRESRRSEGEEEADQKRKTRQRGRRGFAAASAARVTPRLAGESPRGVRQRRLSHVWAPRNSGGDRNRPARTGCDPARRRRS